MLATRLGKTGRDEALLVRPDGIVLEPDLILFGARGPAHTDRGGRARVDHRRPAAEGGGRDRGGRLALDEVKGASEAFSLDQRARSRRSPRSMVTLPSPRRATREPRRPFAALRDRELEVD